MGIVKLSLNLERITRSCSNCGRGLIGLPFCPEHQNSEPDVSKTEEAMNWEFEFPNEAWPLENRWWIGRGSMGSGFEPPGRATHYFSIYNGGVRDPNSMVLDYPLKHISACTFVPESIREAARRLLEDLPGDPKDEKWIRQCYKHWQNTFSLKGELGSREHMFWNKKSDSLFGGEYAWHGMVPVSQGGGPETWEYIKADILNRHSEETHDTSWKKVFEAPPDEWRTAVLWIRQYDPTHELRRDLI
jgi:hypothetical protein